MTTLAVIQARMGSTRFPGKVLTLLDENVVLWHVVRRVERAVLNVVVATPDAEIAAWCADTGNVPCFLWGGPENDCLGRIAAAAEPHNPDVVVRVTGDCPLLEPLTIQEAVDGFQDYITPYLWNGNTVPRGQDVEVWDAAYLRHCAATVTDPWCREHVKPYWMPEPPRPDDEPTEVNTPDDLERIRRMLCATG